MLQSSTNNSSFSLFYPMLSAMDHQEPTSNYYYSVDCTLSLGTPSSKTPSSSPPSSDLNLHPSFCNWPDSKRNPTACNNEKFLAGDPLLLARRFANCDTTSNPLWRNGPKGPKSLCNAYGIRFKKEERRAAVITGNDAVVHGQCPWTKTGTDRDQHNYITWTLIAVSPQFHYL